MSVNYSIEDAEKQYMHDFIKDIIDKFGPRMPGCESETAAAEYIKEEMSKYCTEAHTEKFKFHPRAFLGWIKIVIGLVAVSVILYLLLPFITSDAIMEMLLISASVVLNAIAFIIMWKQFFSYDEFIDKLFKETESLNAVGTIKPKGETRRLIIFSGHHDSARQFNLLKWMKHGYAIVIFLGLGFMFLWMLLSVLSLGLGIFGFNGMFFYNFIKWLFFILGIPCLILLAFFIWPGDRANTVPGAVDNLSAVAVILGLARYLKEHPDQIPESTEIRIISFGCEEAGLRGAYRYVEQHLEELKRLKAEVVNMDMVYDPENLNIFVKESTTRTKHSPKVIDKLKQAGNITSTPIREFGINSLEKFVGTISGGTDAAAFSKAGIDAANFGTIDLTHVVRYYHQPEDDIDQINKDALENAVKILIGYLQVSK
ncbi:M20/M25/M40 family metallo-hydrolase [Candidatus Bathyarchaeota archaeon]|nr:M20/M25/M40 family metallo-hydrolase [Candidatus Bathyarchaeota archaeon]